jgi:hypothetical protein
MHVNCEATPFNSIIGRWPPALSTRLAQMKQAALTVALLLGASAGIRSRRLAGGALRQTASRAWLPLQMKLGCRVPDDLLSRPPLALGTALTQAVGLDGWYQTITDDNSDSSSTGSGDRLADGRGRAS